jgi:hypothetical protein
MKTTSAILNTSVLGQKFPPRLKAGPTFGVCQGRDEDYKPCSNSASHKVTIYINNGLLICVRLCKDCKEKVRDLKEDSGHS